MLIGSTANLSAPGDTLNSCSLRGFCAPPPMDSKSLPDLSSAKMMCGHISGSRSLADEAILVVQSVEDRRRDHMTVSGEAMPRGLWRNLRWWRLGYPRSQ